MDGILSQTVIDARLSGLIGRFYEAVADDALWAGLAVEISDTLESTSAVLKLHGADDDIRLLEHTDNLRVGPFEQARLMEAMALLSSGTPVAQVAFEVGYDSPSSFSATFRRAFGVPPSQYLSIRSMI